MPSRNLRQLNRASEYTISGHMFNCHACRYAWWLPAHALSAVRVLCAVSESPSAHASLLSALGGPSSASVLKGFTDVLDDEQGDECIEQVGWVGILNIRGGAATCFEGFDCKSSFSNELCSDLKFICPKNGP